MPDSAGMARTVTVPGVELVAAGIWAASTGLTTVTRDHLESMVAASRDPAVDAAAVKIGHTDPRFNDGAFDGDPALGWATNLRVEDRTPLGPDGRPVPGAGPVPTLIADLVGVPAGLAAIMPTAYRRRSVEIGWKYRTPAGAEYSAALTGLALLGVTKPAVKGLADVMALYAAATSGGTSAITGGSTRVDTVTALAIDPDLPQPAVLALELARSAYGYLAAAGAVPADVVEAWSDHLEQQVRARLAAGGHHVVNQHPQGGSTVPVDEARIRQLLNLQAGDDIEAAVARLIAGTPAGQTPPGQTPPNNAATVPPTAAQPGQPAPAAGVAPPVIPAGLAPYLLPQPNPAAGGTAAPGQAQAPAAGQPAAPAASGQQPAPVAQPGQGPAPAAPAPAPVAAAGQQPAGFPLPEGMALVSQAVLDELRAGAVAGITAAQELARQGVEREVGAALSAGKIAPAELDAWRNSLLNPASSQQARALLAAMQPRFSTVATTIGSSGEPNTQVEAVAWESWESNVFGIPPTTPVPQLAPAGAAFAGAIPATATPVQPQALPPAAPPQQWGYDAIRGYVPMASLPQGV